MHKYDCTKYYLHIPTSLTINYYFCFENIMNIIFVIESEVVDSPNTLDLLSAFCWSWRLNTSLVKDTSETELEKKICNTVQLTRTMAVGNYACFIKKYKILFYKNVAFLFCYNDDEKVFFFCLLRENKRTKNTRKKNKEMFIRTNPAYPLFRSADLEELDGRAKPF